MPASPSLAGLAEADRSRVGGSLAHHRHYATAVTIKLRAYFQWHRRHALVGRRGASPSDRARCSATLLVRCLARGALQYKSQYSTLYGAVPRRPTSPTYLTGLPLQHPSRHSVGLLRRRAVKEGGASAASSTASNNLPYHTRSQYSRTSADHSPLATACWPSGLDRRLLVRVAKTFGKRSVRRPLPLFAATLIPALYLQSGERDPRRSRPSQPSHRSRFVITVRVRRHCNLVKLPTNDCAVAAASPLSRSPSSVPALCHQRPLLRLYPAGS